MLTNSKEIQTALISSEDDLNSDSLSHLKSKPGSSQTCTIHTSSPEKSISNHSSNNRDHPPVNPNVKPPLPLIIYTSAWRKAATKLMSMVPIDSIIVKAFSNDSVKIQSLDIEMFRIVQKYFFNFSYSQILKKKPQSSSY